MSLRSSHLAFALNLFADGYAAYGAILAENAPVLVLGNIITGTEGHLHVVNGQLFYKSAKTAVPGADGKQPIDKSHFPAALPHAFDLFFEVLAGKQDKSTLIPIEDALNVARAMDAMYLADKLGQWVKV